MLFAYSKNEQDDLTPAQLEILKKLVEKQLKWKIGNQHIYSSELGTGQKETWRSRKSFIKRRLKISGCRIEYSL